MAKSETGSATKIARIHIADFRAFPALAPASVLLDGKNLLAWGENGSGKSSIYRALRGLFSVQPQDIAPMGNVFSHPPIPTVKATLTNQTELLWSTAGHPTESVLDTARKSAFMSHRRLVEMSTGRTANDAPNLFTVTVDKLLADFEGTLDGGNKRTIAELWQEVNTALTRRVQHSNGLRRPRDFADTVKAACVRFNKGMEQALAALEIHAKPVTRKLLDVLQQDPLELVGFTFYGLTYDENARELGNATLNASVKFRDHTLVAPPNFLNEARLSALAIAIYLAGRLACVPQTDNALKLLVLDDLLVSLDYSHRRPVLDVIGEFFQGWQIILLTHDRFWFELAREQLPSSLWKAIEIYEKLDDGGMLRPVIWETQDDLVAETLRQAKRFVDDNQPAAAANYARTACELTLRRYCRNHSIPFGYTDDPQKIKIEQLLTKAETHASGDADRKAALKEVKKYKRLILNPLSHNPTQPIVKADVVAAINAVKELLKACHK